jgi:uncharacterized DUF497 family protein
VFDDPNCLTFVERVEDAEERWHAIGVLDGRAMVTVVHTYRPEGSDENYPDRFRPPRRRARKEAICRSSLKGNAKIS